MYVYVIYWNYICNLWYITYQFCSYIMKTLEIRIQHVVYICNILNITYVIYEYYI